MISDLIVAAIVAALLELYYHAPPSIAPWWESLTFLLAQWPHVITKGTELLRSSSSTPKRSAGSSPGAIPKIPWLSSLIHGGPFGQGCSKIVEVLTAIGLWRLVHSSWPSLPVGPLLDYDWTVWIGLIVFSASVNVVLWGWSTITKSRGNHDGVNDMVHRTQGRSLSIREQAILWILAFLNGTCEEITSRRFWMSEFQNYVSPTMANLAQAAVFGIWHFHGIPSGWTGVGLTFVYGTILGWLYQYGQGLFLPIVTHTVADYYIFAIIARQQQQPSGGKVKSKIR